MGYAKLFSSIIHSTIWREPDHVRIVWVTMLAMSDENGIVECSVPGLADAARVNLQQCISALDRLQSPDEYSRNPENEGRRIEKIDGGFEIINYEIYRRKASEEERRERNAAKQQRHRDRLKAQANNNPTVTPHNPALPEITEITPSDQIRSEADQIRTKTNTKSKRVKKELVFSDEFKLFWSAYPRKVSKIAAYEAWNKAALNGLPAVDVVIAAIEKAKLSQQWIKDGGEFIPYPSSWLNQGRWTDELSTKKAADNVSFWNENNQQKGE